MGPFIRGCGRSPGQDPSDAGHVSEPPGSVGRGGASSGGRQTLTQSQNAKNEQPL